MSSGGKTGITGYDKGIPLCREILSAGDDFLKGVKKGTGDEKEHLLESGISSGWKQFLV